MAKGNHTMSSSALYLDLEASSLLGLLLLVKSSVPLKRGAEYNGNTFLSLWRLIALRNSNVLAHLALRL